MPEEIVHHPSSYRDNSGFIFEYEGNIYRQVNQSFREEFDLLMNSGLYEKLTSEGLLIKHHENHGAKGSVGAYKILLPDQLPFISYPYEWTFEMLRDVALLTLRIATNALRYGMILKDATPYNVQWKDGKWIFIDTLSFEKFREEPWIAYRQFCECLLGPLLIMHYAKKQMPELMQAWPNGIPIQTISSLLPGRSKFSLYTYLHIHLHAKYSTRKQNDAKAGKFTIQKFRNLLKSLTILIEGLKSPTSNSVWSGYYEEAGLRGDYIEQKKKSFSDFVSRLQGINSAIDLGANEGEFSRILASKNIRTIASDMDPYCVERMYKGLKETSVFEIQPLVIDLSNPSPAIGVNNVERPSFLHRAKADLTVALALIHHLCIGKNIPLPMVIDMFAGISKTLIIEFVPKEDLKVQEMLSNRKDIFSQYTQEEFEKTLAEKFTIDDKLKIGSNGRTLYLAQKK